MADQTTTIPKGWKMMTLGEVADVQNGYAFRSDEFSKSGTPIIKIKNIASGKITLDDLDYYEKDIENLKAFQIKKGDILVSMTGSHISQISSAVGKVAKYNLEAVSLLNQRVGKIYPKENLSENKYLWYLVVQPEVQFFWGNKAGGSANQANISPSIIKSYQFISPSLPEQRAIAGVLSSLDDKIELLCEQNKTLEATAQTIFKEWFVNFNFPGATGKMIDSELGEIPEGWKVDRLSEIIVFEGGAQPPKSEHIYEPRDGYVRFIQNRDYSNSSHITYIKESKKNKLCEVYDIMMDKYGDVGVPRWGLVGAYNVALAKIVPKIKNSREYLRSYFSQRAVFSLLSASAQASTRGSLNEGTFKGVTLIIPDEITLERFEKLQSKFLSKILFNNAEVETLSQLRDTLLPKLIKGEIRVKGFEK